MCCACCCAVICASLPCIEPLLSSGFSLLSGFPLSSENREVQPSLAVIVPDDASCIEGVSSLQSSAAKVWDYYPTDAPRPRWYKYKEEASWKRREHRHGKWQWHRVRRNR